MKGLPQNIVFQYLRSQVLVDYLCVSNTLCIVLVDYLCVSNTLCIVLVDYLCVSNTLTMYCPC